MRIYTPSREVVTTGITVLSLMLNALQFYLNRKDNKESKVGALRKEILGLREVNERLQLENTQLKDIKEIEKDLVRYKSSFVTRKHRQDVCYCAVCWGKESKLIQLNAVYGIFRCVECNNQIKVSDVITELKGGAIK